MSAEKNSASVPHATDENIATAAAEQEAMMARELEENWQLILACLGNAVPPSVLDIARSSYWIGVRTGVRVNTEAVSRVYQ
jgi:hypothetical protein